MVVSAEQHVFDDFLTVRIFYDLGHGIQEIIMVLDMVSKTPYMILGMVSKIQPKNFITAT